MADKYASLTLARKRIQERIKRLENLQPVMARVAPAVEKMARASIDRSRSPAGQQFKALAPSTLAARKPGEDRIPLKKTGASYAAIRCFPSAKNGIVLLAPRTLRFHMTAKGRRPKRNAFPFEIGGDDKPHPIPKLDKLIRATLRAYLAELKSPADIPLAAE